jgi:uncharacterized membrane protein
MRMRALLRFLWSLAAFGGLAMLAHQLTLWALPRWIMDRTVLVITGGPGAPPLMPPLTDHTQRRVVLPSPDLLYATCAWDVSRTPLRVRARLDGVPYASLALYAANSDNFWVSSGGSIGASADLWIRSARPDTAQAAAPAGAQVVVAPTDQGLLLMRVLVGHPARDLAAAEAVRQTLRCEGG